MDPEMIALVDELLKELKEIEYPKFLKEENFSDTPIMRTAFYKALLIEMQESPLDDADDQEYFENRVQELIEQFEKEAMEFILSL